MICPRLLLLCMGVLCASGVAEAQAANSCANLGQLSIDGVELTKAAMIPAGATVPPVYPGAPTTGPLPAHCRLDGVINSRK